MCRITHLNREYLKKKNRYDKRKYVHKLYQQLSDEKIIIAKHQKIIH